MICSQLFFGDFLCFPFGKTIWHMHLLYSRECFRFSRNAILSLSVAVETEKKKKNTNYMPIGTPANIPDSSSTSARFCCFNFHSLGQNRELSRIHWSWTCKKWVNLQQQCSKTNHDHDGFVEDHGIVLYPKVNAITTVFFGCYVM